jgi:hypothetical protein
LKNSKKGKKRTQVVGHVGNARAVHFEGRLAAVLLEGGPFSGILGEVGVQLA